MNLTYQWLYDTVRARFNSEEAMEAFLPQALAPEELKRKGDDRFLSAMTQRIFQAGMRHTVADAKWPAGTLLQGSMKLAQAAARQPRLRLQRQRPAVQTTPKARHPNHMQPTDCPKRKTPRPWSRRPQNH